MQAGWFILGNEMQQRIFRQNTFPLNINGRAFIYPEAIIRYLSLMLTIYFHQNNFVSLLSISSSL